MCRASKASCSMRLMHPSSWRIDSTFSLNSWFFSTISWFKPEIWPSRFVSFLCRRPAGGGALVLHPWDWFHSLSTSRSSGLSLGSSRRFGPSWFVLSLVGGRVLTLTLSTPDYFCGSVRSSQRCPAPLFLLPLAGGCYVHGSPGSDRYWH